MLYFKNLVVPEYGDDIEPDLNIQISFGYKSVGRDHQKCNLFPVHRIRDLDDSVIAPRTDFHHGKYIIFFGNDIDFSFEVPEISIDHLIAFLDQIGHCNFLSLFAKFVMFAHVGQPLILTKFVHFIENICILT